MGMAELLRAKVTLSEEDLAAFAQWYYRATSAGRRRMRLLRVLGMIGILGYFYASPPELSAEGALGAFIAAGLLYFAYNFALWYLPPQLARWSARIGPRKVLLEPVLFEFSEDGIEISTKEGRGHAAWSAVREIAEASDHVFVHLEGMSAFILPKKQLESPEAAVGILRQFQTSGGGRP
jgi:hypothetical protein